MSDEILKYEVIKAIREDYFLISRGGFWATLIGTVAISGVVGWQSGKTALGKISEQNLIQEIAAGAEEAKALIDGNHRLPVNSIIAVTGGNHVDDRPDLCPRGWSVFEKANGRTIIGAGPKTEFTSLRTPMKPGGKETTVHAQPSRHAHAMFTQAKGNAPRAPTSGEGVASEAYGRENLRSSYQMHVGQGEIELGSTNTVGTEDPLPNMQPFIALTFCKKENETKEKS